MGNARNVTKIATMSCKTKCNMRGPLPDDSMAKHALFCHPFNHPFPCQIVPIGILDGSTEQSTVARNELAWAQAGMQQMLRGLKKEVGRNQGGRKPSQMFCFMFPSLLGTPVEAFIDIQRYKLIVRWCLPLRPPTPPDRGFCLLHQQPRRQ